MARFSVNTQRSDCYKHFMFRVKWKGRYVAGANKVGMLMRTTEVVKHREGDDPGTSRKLSGRTEFEAITIERGVTCDSEFWTWANNANNMSAGLTDEPSLTDFRKDITIELHNEAGQLASAYKVFRCWVSECQALPDLPGDPNAVAIEYMKLEHEGLERDLDLPEATEPTFTEPPVQG